MLIWKESNGIAPKKVTVKMNKAMLDWVKDLTDCLKIWIDKKDFLIEFKIISFFCISFI